MSDTKILVEGKSCTVMHRFNENRALVDFDGLYVFADQFADGTWELSGEPAREAEKPILKALLDPTNDQDRVTIIKE